MAPGALPADLSSFVGRGGETAEVKGLLRGSRLVTLTGVGGAGKTRLALQVATDVRRAFPDGAWFVDLTHLPQASQPGSEVGDPDLVAHLILAVLGLPQRTGSPVEMLTGYLAGRRALLVLDNCEHAPACAALIRDLLDACPRVRVLATSREPVAVGEVPYPVQPLPVPGVAATPDPDDLSQYDAVVLFVARAQAAAPDFTLTQHNAQPVAELCRRLDGLPLAIELAAARVRALSPQQILDRLADRFALLTRGSRVAPARQKTLRACVEWSFDLCGKPERLLWARLSVFVGGFDLDAVESVCTDAALPAHDVLEALSGLVAKSIVDRADAGDGHDGQPRYRMLETLRAYGHDQLVEAGGHQAQRRRHRDWYRRLTTSAGQEWVTGRQAYWYSRLTRDHANLRAAVDFCLATTGEADAALRIALDLPQQYWWSRGLCSEGVSWFDRALVQATAPTALRAQALAQAAYLAALRGDTTTTRLLDEALDLAHRLDDARALAICAHARWYAALLRNDVTEMVGSAEQGLAIVSAARDPDPTMPVRMLVYRGTAAAVTGDHDRAVQCYRQVVEITEPLGEIIFRTNALWGLAFIAWRSADLEAADHLLSQSLRIGHGAGYEDLNCTAMSLEVLAWIAARRSRHARAATLLGAADALLRDLGRAVPPALAPDHSACQAQAREALGDDAFTSAARGGRTLPLREAVAQALEEPRSPVDTAGEVPASEPAPAASPLTPREHQIAELVADGRSNNEIARTLVISRRTAEGHVQRILTKLGATNRAQIATWVTQNSPDR